MLNSDQRILKHIIRMAENDLGIELTPTGVVEEDVDQGLTWYQVSSTSSPTTAWIRADGGHYVLVDEEEYAIDDDRLEPEPHEPTIDWAEPNKDRCSRCGKPHTDEDPVYWYDEHTDPSKHGYYHDTCLKAIVEVDDVTILVLNKWDVVFSIRTDGYGRVAVVNEQGNQYVVTNVGPDDEQFLSKVQAAMRGLLGN